MSYVTKVAYSGIQSFGKKTFPPP